MNVALALVLFFQFVRGFDPPTTRELHFDGGIAIVEPQGNLEHVVIEDPNGIVQSDSYCDAQSGKYDDIVKLGETLRTAAAFGDKVLLASNASYPLRVNYPTLLNGARNVKSVMVANQGDLVSSFTRFVTEDVRQKLRFMEPHDVFCRGGMAALARGVVWATVDRDGKVKVSVINQ